VRPAAGVASRHADENGHRNTKAAPEERFVLRRPFPSAQPALRARSHVFLCVLSG